MGQGFEVESKNVQIHDRSLLAHVLWEIAPLVSKTNKETKKVVLNYGSYDGYDENLNQEVGFRHIFEISSC